MDALAAFLELTPTQLAICIAVVFAAGVVRGFSGFALSALVMSSLALIIAPVALIPVCWFLEMSATLLMVRGGVREADRFTVVGLVSGTLIGAPIGLYLTNTLPVDTSRAVALCVILTLAGLQLLRVRATALATKPGVFVAGTVAGIVTGLANVGGMVVALYVLAREVSSRVMRASLVAYLAFSSIAGLGFLIAYGMMDSVAVSRGLFLSLPCMIGVLFGKALFLPRFERYYKPLCLALLMMLAGAGLLRLAYGI